MDEQDRFSLGVFACVFNRDFSKVLMLKRNAEKRAFWSKEWGNVGGKVEFGESSVEACIREADEEIGVVFRPEDLVLLEVRESPHFLPHVSAVQFVYATSIDEGTRIDLNVRAPTKESDGYQWFALNALPEGTLDPAADIIRWAAVAKERIRARA